MSSNSVDLDREGFGTSSWRLVEMDAGQVSTYASINKAFENTVRWLRVLASVFSLSTFNKVGERTALLW